MTLKENNNRIVDEAWDHLYTRLATDGLIPETDKPRRTILHITKLKWAATIAILCICIAAVLLIRNTISSETELLTLYNDKDTQTLVTTLEDGSVIYLSDYTSIQYPKHFQKENRKVVLKGDAFFEINKDKNRPFIIDTESATVEVLGTSFNIKNIDKSSFSLSVKTGEVRVTSKLNGKSVSVKAGQTALLESGNLLTRQSSGKWLFNKYTEQIHFKDERLSDIVKVINMNSDSLKLQISPQLEGRMLTVTFGRDTPETMARLICMALNLQSIQEQNTIVITEK